MFLNTPTWWDLRPWTVLRIVGIGGDGVLHVAHYIRPAPADDIRPLRLTHAQYARLVAAIDRVAADEGPRVRIAVMAGRTCSTTPPALHAAHTCNQWTSDMLAAAGVKTGWWTPIGRRGR